MPLFNITQLRALLAPGQRLLGVDPGSRSVGLALSDVGRMIATPCGTVPRKRLATLAAAIGALGARENVGGLVVGLPLSMDGSFGPAAQSARDFAHAVSASTGLPAALWDERLSSAAVNRVLIEQADASRRRRAAAVDGMAAAYLLQGALDASADGRVVK
jgi:putative Holliday junction resolvase